MKRFYTLIVAAALMLTAAASVLTFPQTTSAASRTDPAPQIASAGVQQYCTYVVKRGEALYMIAARYHVTTAYLAQLNNLYNPNYIYAGMVLRVPCPNPYPPQPNPYPPGPSYPICNYYIVQPGDWVKTIAYRFGTTWQAIAIVNRLPNPNVIYPGQRLAIPCPYPPPQPPPPVCPGCPPCQGCPPYPPPPPPVYPTPAPIFAQVQIRDNFFAPAVITVHQYQVVQWTNMGNASHTVTQGLCPNGVCTPTPGGFNSGLINPGQSFQYQFNTLGTFAYFSGPDGAGMVASVAVVP